MERRATGIIAVLGATVVALAVALIFVIATDGGGTDTARGVDSYMGMMQAMGNMDSDAMLAQMRQALGDDDYQRMLQHFAGHREGRVMMGDVAVDGMMHRMMDGMMQQMPDDQGRMMPLAPAATPRQ